MRNGVHKSKRESDNGPSNNLYQVERVLDLIWITTVVEESYFIYYKLP